MQRLVLTIAFVFVLSACVPASTRIVSQALPAEPATAVSRTLGAPERSVSPALLGNGKIQHVVIIIQENHSTDNLFNGLPGADTVTSGRNTAGQVVRLQSARLTVPWDPGHSHTAFNIDYDGGRMDGFNLEQSRCRNHGNCIRAVDRA